MPLPTPGEKEEQQAFVDRCMSDETMVGEYEDEKQRYAVCQQQWQTVNAARASDLPVTLTFPAEQLELRAAEGRQRVPRMRIVAYTGGEFSLAGWPAPVVVRLSGLKLPAKVPVLADHDDRSRVGHGVPSIEGGRLIVDGMVSVASSAVARELIESAPAGFPWGASIGATKTTAVKHKKGSEIVVNGRSLMAGAGGLIEVTEAVLKEVSVVALAADGETDVQVAASMKKELEMPPDQDEPKDVQAKDVAKDAVKEPEVNVDEIRAAAVKEERERLKAIEAACRTFDGDETVADLKAKAVAGDITLDALKDSLLEHVRASRPKAPRPTESRDTLDPKVIEAALCLRGGVGDEKLLLAAYGEERLNRAYDVRRHIGLRRAAELLAAAKGVELPGDLGSREWIRAAFSTTDLSGILGAVANKALQAAFTAAPSVVPQVAKAVSHSNFHSHTVYSLAVSGDMEEVGPDGELKHLEFEEESRTRQVGTRGAILRITRQDLVNDELGAFTDNGARLGRKAVVARENALFTAINATAEGSSHFTSVRGNYFEGAATNLQLSSLGTAVQMFRDQTGPDGDPVMIEPRVLLVPTTLEETAKALMDRSASLIAVALGSTSSKSKEPNANVFAGQFDVAVSPWLNNSALTGYSTTAWYLIADPADVPAFEVAYLNGLQQPTVEYFGLDADPNVLGVTWRCYWDFGVALAEYRAGVKSNGAAGS